MTRTRTNLSMFVSATIAVWTLAPGQATAGEDLPGVEIIEFAVGGSGCPEGTATAVPSEDNQELFITLDEDSAQDDEYASCNVAVALRVPEGFTVALDMALGGYASIPDLEDARGRVRAEYFFTGGMGPVLISTFPGGFEGNFEMGSQLGSIWAPCGPGVIARVNTSIRTWGSGSLLTIDHIAIYFHSAPC